MKVMILSGRFGFGHEMAANAVREEFERQDKKTEIIQKDLLDYLYPRISKIIYKVFGLVAERYHGIYNLVYKLSKKINSGPKQGGMFISRKFQRMMEEYMPDLLVCTHPFCAKAAAAYKAETDSRIPLATCITDISKCMEWVTWQTDIYLVPVMEIKRHLIDQGVMRENILAAGIPVRRQFLEKGYDKCESKIKRVLIMGGGLGIMPKLDELLYTLHEMPDVRTTVITGKNRKLYEMWKGYFDDVEVLGYVENVSSYTRKADMVISKAGGITLFEILHSKVPVFIIHPFLEQEIKNAKYAQEKGFAKVIWSKKEDFSVELRNILEDSEQLEEMRLCMDKAQKEMMDTDLKEAVSEMTRRALEYLSAYSFAFPSLSIAGQISKPLQGGAEG